MPIGNHFSHKHFYCYVILSFLANDVIERAVHDDVIENAIHDAVEEVMGEWRNEARNYDDTNDDTVDDKMDGEAKDVSATIDDDASAKSGTF